MLSFFLPKDRWKWDPSKGAPDKKVLKLQRQTLRSGSDDVKRCLLEHIANLADSSVELQSALCDGKVTADVCICFLSGSATVQQAAANALAALCDGHPGNCAAVVSARHTTLLSSPRQPLPHALKLLHDKNLDLALAAAGLLDSLAACESGAVVAQLHQPGCVTRLLTQMRSWSRGALTAGAPPAVAARLLRLLGLLLGVAQAAASAGGAVTCRELFKAGVMGLLLEMAQEHRGQQDPRLPRTEAGGEEGGGGGWGHAAVVRDALNLLFVMLSQVPAHRLKLQEADGVQRLLAVLRDLQLPWSVRLQAVAALTAAAASPAVAEDVRAKGLGLVVPMISAFVRGREVPGSPGAAGTPQRTHAPAGPDAAAASPPPLASPADSVFDGSPGSFAAAAGAPDPEPRTEVVVEALLGLLGAVAGATEAGELVEEPRLAVLLAALNSGMASFSGGGYRTATAAAQVLFRLASSRPDAPLPPALSGPNVTGPLMKLVARALDYAAASSWKDAQVLHGAWCAEGLLCKVMEAEQRRSDSARAAVGSGGMLQQGVRLLEASAPVLLVAVGAAPPPYAAPAASVWQTPGVPQAEELRPDGRAYLAKERVSSDLRACAPLLLALLGDLAQHPVHQPALRDMGVSEAARRLLPWKQVQWRVKRLLHLLGELEVEYKPFTAYGCGPLLAGVLASQRLDPRPFLEAGVDAHLLLRLEEGHMRERLGLDELDVLKVSRLRDAHSLFSAIDAVDGRLDGCVTATHLEKYLTTVGSLRQREAQELSETTFRQMQVLPGEPANFMQFLAVYPSLEGELEAVMPQRPTGRGAGAGDGGGGSAAAAFNYGTYGGGGGSAAGPSGGAGAFAAGEGGGAARAWKRQRVGGEGADGGARDGH
ncbi:hypothetical protein PLESTB_001240700 [Pleodorina starrii]|uniref:Uncharacterized protein n=1 Tax=Pleodorina starrii TaxID=330485 RepID=A0A9W6BTN9_9CHLO|nr:hypothetical protein PLESTM_000219100 [Pleodorina starrii]GLC57562.1 hypothetical protein PLESTB_001240700 [Pleodorina starrii]